MFKTILKTILAPLSLLAFGLTAHAAPVTWVLNDVTFASGEVSGPGPYDGVATGSFTYDADTNTYSNVNITTTGSGIWGTDNCGDSVLCGTYIRATNLYAPLTSTSLQITPTASDPVDSTGYYGISFKFDSALTNAGGTVQLLTSGGTDGEGICKNPDCLPEGAAGVTAFRGFSGGSVSAVPVPAAVWLFGSALIGLVGIRRKK